MGRKLTNEIVDRQLIEINSTFERVEDYRGILTPILLKCKVCKFIKPIIPNNALNGSGCNNCCGHERLTNEIIDKRLLDDARLIKRISDYPGECRLLMEWLCLVKDCGKSWISCADKVLNAKHGCHYCAKNLKQNNEIIDKRLKEDGDIIERIGDYVNATTPVLLKCKKCKHDWYNCTNTVLIIGNGCPNCARRIPWTNEIIDQRLLKENRKIKRIGECKGSNVLMPWECLEELCKNEWPATPSHIFNRTSGCPKCNRPGVNEKLVGKELDKFSIWYEYDYCINNINKNAPRPLRLDYFIPEFRLAIEYQGIQHYEPVEYFGGEAKFIELQVKDKYKKQFCIDNKIYLIEIDGREFGGEKLQNYVNEIITKLIFDRSG